MFGTKLTDVCRRLAIEVTKLPWMAEHRSKCKSTVLKPTEPYSEALHLMGHKFELLHLGSQKIIVLELMDLADPTYPFNPSGFTVVYEVLSSTNRLILYTY